MKMRRYGIAFLLGMLIHFYAAAQDFSNKGKEFWLAYSYHVGMVNSGAPQMTLYITSDHEILLILRHGKWDLPKGKLDEKEALETCAIREIAEETGLENHKIEKPLTITYHTYHQDGKHILKESHWFLMQSPKQSVFTPQTEEGITKCQWVPVNDIATYMENTHASIMDVVQEAVKILHETKNT